ncbi:hypothetical protein [Shimazuella kribbensis]|uniref:hypothetical protein n=1 Tax=Shimazuella kribbensis TaxID=139808 RepID=UPI000490F2FF|nr:hypothetical protein [Shimazuella kribbensis]
MNKAIVFFYNIKNFADFEKFYIDILFPKVHSRPEVICTNVTTVNQDETNTTDVQIIIETVFESESALYKDLATPESKQLMQMIVESSLADFYFYLGTEQRFDFKETAI